MKARSVARSIPFALLACFAIAATLYLARYPRIPYAEIWGLLFISVAAFAAAATYRRATGMPIGPPAARPGQRLWLAMIISVVVGLVAIELSAVAIMFDERGAEWWPAAAPFFMWTFPRMLFPNGVLVALMTTLLATIAYLYRAAGLRALLLTSMLLAGLAAVYGRGLLHFVGPAVSSHHIFDLTGAGVGLIVALTFWALGGPAAAAALASEVAGDDVADGSPGTAPAAWAGVRHAVWLTVAILSGFIVLLPLVAGRPGVYVTPYFALPLITLGLIILLIVAIRAAGAAKLFDRPGQERAFRRGVRFTLCAFSLFLNLWLFAAAVAVR